MSDDAEPVISPVPLLSVTTPDGKAWPVNDIAIERRCGGVRASAYPSPPAASSVYRTEERMLDGVVARLTVEVCKT